MGATRISVEFERCPPIIRLPRPACGNTESLGATDTVVGAILRNFVDLPEASL